MATQNEVIESTWREGHEMDDEIEEKTSSTRSKWDKMKMKWNKRQRRHSYWR